MCASPTPALVLCAALIAIAVSGCGGSETVVPQGDRSAGEQLVNVDEGSVEPNCGLCHRLAVAEFEGTSAPDLDELRPGYERVFNAVRDGPGAMPSYDQDHSDAELHHIAAYISEVAGR